MSGMITLVIGALLGWLAGLTHRFWQHRIEENSQRHNELQASIMKAANISTDYWLKIETLTDRQAEARLVGFFFLLNGISQDLARASGDDPAIHAQRLADFNDLITGGPNYEDDERSLDASRAMAVQLEAAKLNLHFQEYRRRQLTLWRSFRIVFSRTPAKPEAEGRSAHATRSREP